MSNIFKEISSFAYVEGKSVVGANSKNVPFLYKMSIFGNNWAHYTSELNSTLF